MESGNLSCQFPDGLERLSYFGEEYCVLECRMKKTYLCKGFSGEPTSDESKSSSFLYVSVHGIFFICEIEVFTVLQCTFC